MYIKIMKEPPAPETAHYNIYVFHKDIYNDSIL